jgi:hypothetical protein
MKMFLESQSIKKELRFRNSFTGCPTLAAYLFLRLEWDTTKSTFYSVFHKSALYQGTTSVVPKRA